MMARHASPFRRLVPKPASPGRLLSWLLLPGLLIALLATGGRTRGDDAGASGGTPAATSKGDRTEAQSRAAIDKGLQCLLSAMHRDGTLGTDTRFYSGSDLGCTAMVGLALLAEGSTPNGGKYARESRLLLSGLLNLVEIRLQDRESAQRVTLVQHKIGMDADLFLAAHYLSEVYFEASGEEKAIHSALERIVKHVCSRQQADGTWGSKSWAPVLGTVLGWRCLTSAHSTGFKVDASAKLVGQSLVQTLEKHTEDRESWMHHFYRDASSLRVLYSLGEKDSPLFKETFQRLMTLIRESPRPFDQAGGEEYLAFSLVTECLLKEQRQDWSVWYPRVQSGILRMQNSDGSWSGHHCITDRTFCTAAALLTLLAPRRNLVTSDL